MVSEEKSCWHFSTHRPYILLNKIGITRMHPEFVLSLNVTFKYGLHVSVTPYGGKPTPVGHYLLLKMYRVQFVNLSRHVRIRI